MRKRSSLARFHVQMAARERAPIARRRKEIVAAREPA
jgi:hypothetical protein